MPRHLATALLAGGLVAQAATGQVDFGEVTEIPLDFPAYQLGAARFGATQSLGLIALHTANHRASHTPLAAFTFPTGADLGSRIPTGATPKDIALADMDGDGRLDLVACSNQTNRVSIALDNGDGSFDYTLGPIAGVVPFAVATADLDGDGLPDVVTANHGAGTISVMFNLGDGALTDPLQIPAGPRPAEVHAADLDGDGADDLIVADALDHEVRVLMNRAFGDLETLPPIPTGSSPASIATAHLDADGRLDLAIANAGSGNVLVLRGLGDGTFGAPQTLATGPQPGLLRIADLNRDGLPDIVAPNLGDRAVTLLLNRGALGWDIQRITLPYYPSAAEVIDADGDGSPDLAIARAQQAVVEIWQGLAPAPGGDCPGDANGDLHVNIFDFAMLASHFGELVEPGTLGDVNLDGQVDAFDFGVFADHFGLTCAPD
jgi:hypothetical protein